MQTFLPVPDFRKSAELLDKKRAWKQVVEAKQIINAIEKINKREKVAWGKHPAVLMWVGYEDVLNHYYNVFLNHAKEVLKINTKMEYMNCSMSWVVDGAFVDRELDVRDFHNFPWWFGNEAFHRAMRARLIEKDEVFYLPKFPDDRGFNEGKYFWPVNETKTFRII